MAIIRTKIAPVARPEPQRSSPLLRLPAVFRSRVAPSTAELPITTPEPGTSSPLLRLPAELRIAIYNYVLLEPSAIYLYSIHRYKFVGPWTYNFTPKRCQAKVQQPGLLRSCGQIRNETLCIF